MREGSVQVSVLWKQTGCKWETQGEERLLLVEEPLLESAQEKLLLWRWSPITIRI